MSKRPVAPNSEKARLKALAERVKDTHVAEAKLNSMQSDAQGNPFLPDWKREVRTFLSIIQYNPESYSIIDFVGTPIETGGEEGSVQSDSQIKSTEMDLFDGKELTSDQHKKNYFYQQLLVACLEDKDFPKPANFSIEKEGLDSFDDDTLSIDVGEESPVALYLLIKFQDLKNRNPSTLGNLTYNQFKAAAQQAFEDEPDKQVRALINEENLELVIEAIQNPISLDRRSVASQETGEEDEMNARSVVSESAGSVHSQLGYAMRDEALRAGRVAFQSHQQGRGSFQPQRQETRSVDSANNYRMPSTDTDSVNSAEDNRVPYDIDSVNSQQDVRARRAFGANSRPRNRVVDRYEEPDIYEEPGYEEPGYEEPDRHQTSRSRRSGSPAASAVPTSRYRRSGEGGRESDFEEPLGSSVNIEGILNEINVRLNLISEKIANGEPVGAIASLNAMQSYLAAIGRRLPDEGAFAALQNSVSKIGLDIAKIIAATPAPVRGADGAPGVPGAPGAPGAAADLTPITVAIKQVAQDAKTNANALKDELLEAGVTAESLAQERYRILREGHDDLVNRHGTLEGNIFELGGQVGDLEGKLDSVLDEVSGIRKDMANSVVKDGVRRHIDHVHLNKYGYNKDSDGNEFLIPEIKGQVTATHSGIEQHESCGIPVFVYEDMDAFSKDVESAALRPWPDSDSEKIVSSIARIEGKGYCTVTASSRGVSKTFLDDNQFEELEEQAQQRYNSVIQAQAKREELEKVIKLLEEKMESHIADSRMDVFGVKLDEDELGNEEDLEQARSIEVIIDYLRGDVLKPLAHALDPTKKMSAVDRDLAIKEFNGWDCQQDLGFSHNLKFKDNLLDFKLQIRKKGEGLQSGLDGLSGVIEEDDIIGNDYREEIISYLKNTALKPLYEALDLDNKMSEEDRNNIIKGFSLDWESGQYLDEHLNSPEVQARMKANALKRSAASFKIAGWNDGEKYLLEIIGRLDEALDPKMKMSDEDRDAAIKAFYDWDPSEDVFFADAMGGGANEQLIRGCIYDVTDVRNFAKKDIILQSDKKGESLELVIKAFEDKGLWNEGAEYLYTNILAPFLEARDLDVKMSQSERDAAIKAFYDWDIDQDEFLKNNQDEHDGKAIDAYRQEIQGQESRKRDSGTELSSIYTKLSESIANFARNNSISRDDIQEYAKVMESSVNRFDDEDERLEKLTQANSKASSNQKNSARKFASNQLSRDLVEDVKQSVKTSEINDLDSSEVDHMVDHMVSKMHGAAASVTGHNKNRRNESTEKAREILTAPMPHTPKNGISFFRPRDSNTVTIAFNYNNVKDNKLDGDSLAYFHIPGTNEMYGRAQICKDPTKPMAVMKNGKEVLEYHKFGDVVIDPDTIFHRNAAGKYDHFGTTGTLWNDMESTFGEKGKNAIKLYQALGVKAISQINRAGIGEEPDVERKVAVLCEGQAFAYNGERAEKNVHNTKEVRLYGGDERAQGREEKALGKKKNAVDENDEEVVFKVNAKGEVEFENDAVGNPIKSKLVKLSKMRIPTANGKVEEEVELFSKVTIDSAGNITHEASPYVTKQRMPFAEDTIEDLLCRQYCKNMTKEEIQELSTKLASTHDGGLISTAEMKKAGIIDEEESQWIIDQKDHILSEFMGRSDANKKSVNIAGKDYPIHVDADKDRFIYRECEPIEVSLESPHNSNLDPKHTQQALNECKNTKLVVTVARTASTGEVTRAPVVSVHDEFEGLGHRKNGVFYGKEKATVKDEVDLGAVPESENFSHVNRARSPKTRGGGRV